MNITQSAVLWLGKTQRNGSTGEKLKLHSHMTLSPRDERQDVTTAAEYDVPSVNLVC